MRVHSIAGDMLCSGSAVQTPEKQSNGLSESKLGARFKKLGFQVNRIVDTPFGYHGDSCLRT